jgi:hypothetical protein
MNAYPIKKTIKKEREKDRIKEEGGKEHILN